MLSYMQAALSEACEVAKLKEEQTGAVQDSIIKLEAEIFDRKTAQTALQSYATEVTAVRDFLFHSLETERSQAQVNGEIVFFYSVIASALRSCVLHCHHDC